MHNDVKLLRISKCTHTHCMIIKFKHSQLFGKKAHHGIQSSETKLRLKTGHMAL